MGGINKMVDYKEEYAKAGELEIELKDGILEGSDKKMNRTLMERYHLDAELDDTSDEYENLYYNADLRSFSGFIYEFPNVLILWPEYYVPGFEDYFKRLIKDAIKVEVRY